MLEGCRRSVVGWVVRGAPWAALAATPITGGACREETTRPVLASDCNDPACVDARGSGVVSAPRGAGPVGAAGAAGAAGGGGMPEPTEGTLAGSVLQVVTSDLTSAVSLQGDVEIRSPSTDPTVDEPLVAEPALDGTYRLEGVEVGKVVWVAVGAFQDPPSGPFIDTLQAVDSTRASFVNLLVVRRDVLTDVASASFINSPVELDPTRSQVVVHFVDEDGLALEGVQVQFPPPDQVPTAYDDGDIYTDALDATSTRGMAVLANLNAPPYPGGSTTIVANLDGATFTTEIQIAAGALTVVSAVIEQP
jgi:hypothetical protein